ncbi:MAG: hypothetical protein JO087_09135 [Actinobacteria bacterium]|nr:hypothetical protein [Actinomycetota bacterium]
MNRSKLLRRSLAGVIATLLLCDLLGLFSVLRRVTPVTVDTAVSRFRAAQYQAGSPAPGESASAAAGPVASVLASTQAPVPTGAAPASTVKATKAAATRTSTATPVATPTQAKPGVYVYATNGFETLAVLSARHDYPAQTTMTVTPNDCGRAIRWDGLDQRYDSWDTCAAGQGVRLRSFVSYHNFYGQAVRRDYTCTPSTYFRPDADQAGTKFLGECHSSDGDAILDGRIVGIETLTVAGQAVPVVHVRVDETLTGGTKGTRAADSWYAVADNLLVKRTSATDADTQTPFGYSHYHEVLSVTLADLHPRQ